MCLCDRKEKFTNFQMLCVNCRSSAVQFGSLSRSKWKEPELDQPSAKINSNKFQSNNNCLYTWNALRAYILLEWNFTHPKLYLFICIFCIRNKHRFIEPNFNELFVPLKKWPEHKKSEIIEMYKTADLLFILGVGERKTLKIQMQIPRNTERLLSLKNPCFKISLGWDSGT